MTILDKNKVLNYLEEKRKAYKKRLDVCKTENHYPNPIDYKIRIKTIEDLIIYVSKLEYIDKDKFVKSIEQKRNSYRKMRDSYESKGQESDSASCKIRIIPLERMLFHIIWGDFNEDVTRSGKDDSILKESSETP
jgi:hypothetical protein